MSVLALIGNSRGRFNKKRRPSRPKAANSPGKGKPPKRAVSTAQKGDPRAPRKGESMGDGEKLVRMRRLREEKESVPEQDAENTDMIRRIGGDPLLAQGGDERNGDTEQAEDAIALSDERAQGATLSTETTELIGALDGPCAAPNQEAPQSSEDSSFFGDLFKAVVEDEATPVGSLTASIPNVSARQLLSEAEQIKTMARRKPRGAR
jgi:hypothetical protein